MQGDEAIGEMATRVTEGGGAQGGTGPAFVGRDRELEELRRAFLTSREGTPSLLTVTGEPGIGKTRLAEALTEHARADGAEVLWGRSWEGGGAPAYWPWIQVLGPVVRALGPEPARKRLGERARYLGELVPELRSKRTPDRLTDPQSDASRFALFEAVTELLAVSAEPSGLVVVLDDLHAADLPSLLMLQFVARELRDAKVLLLGTYRELEAHRDPDRARVIADIAREATPVRLRGLAHAEVTRFVYLTAGREAAPELVAAIHRTTEGNPFFIDELVRLIVSERGIDAPPAGELPIPDEVRETVRRRLDPLSPDTRELLATAAVLGVEFTTRELCDICGTPDQRMLELLDAAAGHRLIRAEEPGRWRFAHALVRETLYSDLPRVERTELHATAGEALERLHASDRTPVLSRIAHHFFEAAGTADAARAVAYSRQAGDQAHQQFAYEEAAENYERALRALELADDADPRTRCDLLLALGDVRWSAGEADRSQETFREAAALAERIGYAEALARAALGYGGQVVAFETGLTNPLQIELFEKALAALPAGDGALRSRVMARLAGALTFSGAENRRLQLAEEAVEMARRLNDPQVLGQVLLTTHPAIWRPENLDERRARAAEVLRVADQVGDRRLAAEAHDWRFSYEIESGDRAGAERELHALKALAEELREPWHTWVYVLQLADLTLVEGRFDEAERLSLEAFEIGQRAGIEIAQVECGGQLAVLRREQGRLTEVIQAAEAFAREFPNLPGWRAVVAWMHADLGNHDAARRELDAFPPEELATSIPRDMLWLSSVVVLAETAAALESAGHVAALHDLLRPYSRRVATPGGGVCFGTSSHALGMLAAALGDFDEAAGHFDDALKLSAVMRARPWTCRTQYEYGRLLHRRGSSDDRVRASEFAAAALAGAEELGMADLTGRASSLVDELAREAPPAERTERTTQTARRAAVLHQEGEYWTLSYSGSPFRLKDSKGLHHLAALLAQPNTDFHATELGGTPGEEGGGRGSARADGLAVRAARDDDTGAMLDSRAKTEYRARLEELREELDEAERFADPERAARARDEIELLTQELARAVGLGGRDRKSGSTSERARVNATRAIKVVLDRIAEHDAALAHHLRSCVKTGTYCSYRPDPTAPLEWSLRDHR